MKKLISAILAGSMVASMAVMASAADDFTNNVGTDVVEATYTMYNADGNPLAGRVNVNLPAKYEVVENGANVVKPGGEIYIRLNGVTTRTDFTDDDQWKVKTDKGDDNARMIASISLVEKDEDFGNGREPLIKIKLNDDQTSDDYKISPQITLTAKDDVEWTGTQTGAYEDCEIVINVTGWMGNVQRDGDEDWDAGQGGYIAKPTKDDENEITWHNENNDIARLTFDGDSDVSKYYPKLSTKWVDSTYSEVIGNADGFVLEFVGNPAISSTSRATLEIYNPYINDDDEYDVAVEDLRVYLADAEGVLEDITDSCTLGTNDDDDEVITLRTRQLGTYVVSPFPVYTLTEEESARALALQSRLGPYVDETLARVVLGEMDADEAQTFLDGLYERGMQEMIDLWQSVAVRLGV